MTATHNSETHASDLTTASTATLTARQQRFVDEYMVDLNATQAAIRAGYSAKTANEQAGRLLEAIREA